MVEIAAGPVRTGKTRAWLEKAHYVCCNFPGARVLFVRQTKHSLAQTVLLNFERDVLPAGYTKTYTGKREYRQSYEYLNGSEIVLTGLDDLSKLLSGEYDLIIVFQAEECQEADVMGLTTRLSNNRMPFQQLGMDCNPRGKSHWIKQGIDAGKFHCLNFTFQDNPVMYDPDRHCFTPFGAKYIANLEQTLTGHQKERMLHGRWANPQGARFKNADRSRQGFRMFDVVDGRGNVTTPGLFPQGLPSWWKRILHVDWGRADPYCCLWTAIDENGEYWTYMEDYTAGYEASEQAQRVVAYSPASESYEHCAMDQSMFSDQPSFGFVEGRGPAAQQYQEVFEAANKEANRKRFGPCIKGAKNIDEIHYVTLEYLLTSGKWHVELGCVNLWNQLEDAVYYLDPRTGIQYDRVNPFPGKKTFQDHAIETAGYGLHKSTPKTKATDANIPVDYEAVRDEERGKQVAAYRRALDRKRKPNASTARY